MDRAGRDVNGGKCAARRLVKQAGHRHRFRVPDLPPPPDSLLDQASLFLDFDGTLVELAERPDAIVVPGATIALLGALQQRLNGRLAVVSGRAVADLETYLPARDMVLCGSHGMELRLGDGTLLPIELPPGLDVVRARARNFAAAHPGLLAEDKKAGVAMHYRQAPDLAAVAGDFMERLAREAGLLVQRGHMVIELRPDGADKGDAVRALMAQAPFAGARPIFVGDDLTDEHGFAVAAELGGAGVLVGVERPSAALYRLPSVGAVTAWLEGER